MDCRWHKKIDKNCKVAHEAQPSVLLIFLARFLQTHGNMECICFIWQKKASVDMIYVSILQ